MKTILGLLANKGISSWGFGLLAMALLFANASSAWADHHEPHDGGEQFADAEKIDGEDTKTSDGDKGKTPDGDKEKYDVSKDLSKLKEDLAKAKDEEKEGLEGKIETLEYAINKGIALESGFTEGEDGDGDKLAGWMGLTSEGSGPASDRFGYAYSFFTTSMLWTVIAAAMVFIMHLGFATLESGLCQRKNVVNVLFKNVFIISIGIVSYAVIGFNTHYPGDSFTWLSIGGMIGDLNAEGSDNFGYGGVGLAMTGYGDFIFQAMFAATGATIVSGAVAERVKLPSFMIFATLFVGLAYPIAGSWHWGGGYLAQLDIPFKDFAGSTVVHAFGGFGALACVLVLGPRKGKYTKNGIKPIPAHSFPLATIGVFLLFFGWYGFNGGSVLSAEPGALGLVFTTTTLAACAGGLGAIATSWYALKKPDLSMALNGILAGLVGITANADVVSASDSLVIGLIAGIIVVYAITFFDKIKIDDPVGAISVHGVCGIWGTVAVALFGEGDFSLATQIQGALLVSAFAFVFAYVVFSVLKATIGVRVSEEEEERGLDITEHGQEAYTG